MAFKATRSRAPASPSVYKVEANKLYGIDSTTSDDNVALGRACGISYFDVQQNGGDPAPGLCNFIRTNHGEIGTWMHAQDNHSELYYFFGPMVLDKSFVPAGMSVVEVPAAEYAVFQVPAAGSAQELSENIKKTWKFIFNDWFDGSEYKFDHSAMDFEYYLDENTYIYVPVVKK